MIRIQARLKHMCFKLLRSNSCALIHIGNLLQDLHCVIPRLTVSLTPSFPPPPGFDLLKHSCGNHLFVFLCQALSRTPLFLSLPSTLFRSIIMLLQTIQANHNAGSIRIQQSYRSVSNQASWLLSIRSWVWPRSGNGSVWWPRSGRVSAW